MQEKGALALSALLLAAALLSLGCSPKASILGGAGTKRFSYTIASLRAAAGNAEKRRILGEVEGLYADAHFHQKSIEQAAEMIAVSERNLDSLAYAAELVARVGFQTKTILDVAEAASKAKMQIPEFRDLVELAVIRLSGADKLVEAANRAASVDSPEDLPELRRRIAALRAEAECRTVDEAVEAVESMQRNIGNIIKSVGESSTGGSAR